MPLSPAREVLIYRASKEQDHDDGCSDPHRAVEIGIPFEHVEEVETWVDGGFAAAEYFGCVDVEGLGVEGEGPEVVFSAGGGGGSGAGKEGRVGGSIFGGAA